LRHEWQRLARSGLDGNDMRRQPLANRKAALARLLRKARPGIRYSEHISDDGRIVFEHA
jgi:bifunctional non-homologous end joining protein LigD